MDKPKLTLAPPPPELPLDVPQSRTWSDGSGRHITSAGITLYEAQAQYLVKPCLTALSLINPAPR